jgi:hypothetical protein
MNERLFSWDSGKELLSLPIDSVLKLDEIHSIVNLIKK